MSDVGDSSPVELIYHLAEAYLSLTNSFLSIHCLKDKMVFETRIQNLKASLDEAFLLSDLQLLKTTALEIKALGYELLILTKTTTLPDAIGEL